MTAPGPASVTADEVSRAIARCLPYAGPDRVHAAADAVMAAVSPVLDARDERIRALKVLAEGMYREYKPYPRPDSTGFFRPAVPVSEEKYAEWRAVLDGEKR